MKACRSAEARQPKIKMENGNWKSNELVNTPDRPDLLSTLIHSPSLPQSTLADKMWFGYRSQQADRDCRSRTI